MILNDIWLSGGIGDVSRSVGRLALAQLRPMPRTEYLAAMAGKVADPDDSFAHEALSASSLAQRVVAEPGRTLHGDRYDHAFESVCMNDFQHSKQPLVPSPSPSGININGDISADTVLIVRRVRPEYGPAVNALVERPVRDW